MRWNKRHLCSPEQAFWVTEKERTRRSGMSHRRKMEEKTRGWFIIHLLVPDIRSILSEPEQNTLISLNFLLFPPGSIPPPPSKSLLIGLLNPHSLWPSVNCFLSLTRCYFSSYTDVWRLLLMVGFKLTLLLCQLLQVSVFVFGKIWDFVDTKYFSNSK